MGRASLTSPFVSTVLSSGRAILYAGSEAQKQEHLPKIAAGDALIAFAALEAGGAPTAAGVKCAARRVGDSFVIDGSKWFVEFAGQSDRLLVLASTRGDRAPEDGLTLFLVERDTPGVRCETLRTVARDSQAKIMFENVKVGTTAVVGPVDGAWPIVERVLQEVSVALCGYMSGLGERAIELCVDYAKQRVQFGRPIGSFQALQNYMAPSHAEVTAGEYLSYFAAFLLDRGIPATAAVSTAKAFVGHACKSATQISSQIHGGLGAMEDGDVTLYLRRAKQCQLSLGTSQFHENILAGEILDKVPRQLDAEFAVAIR
jgi:alkylation response protein AidB-like acyl-CoA dehydrogenase